MVHGSRGAEVPTGKAVSKQAFISLERVNIAKPGRKPKFTSTIDVVIAREMAAAKSCVAPYGDTKQGFESAADSANRNAALSTTVMAKSI